MPLRLAKLAFEAVVEMAMIRQLLINRAVVELLSSKLHVVVSSLHSNHVLEALHELFVFERLRNVVVRAAPENARTRLGHGRQQNDRDETIVCDRFDDFTHIDSAKTRHVELEDDEVDRLCANGVDGLLPTVRADDRQASRAK